MNNQECNVRPQMVNVNSNESMFYPFSIETSKCSGSCNNINDPYAKMCVPDVIKHLNVKVFNLISRTNEARHIEWHETWKCKCRLSASVYNNKQRWNDNKCRCECKELIDTGVYDKRFIWDPSNCECECNKSCDVGEYLDYKKCNCRKKIVDKLIEECTETVKEAKIENTCTHNSCTLYIVLFFIFFTINIGIGAYFVYLHWYLKTMLLVLSLVLVLKQQFIKFSFIELINGRSQTNRNQKWNLLFLQRHDKKHYKRINIYYIGYITIKKLVIVKLFTAQIFCICLLIMQVDILKKKMEINT